MLVVKNVAWAHLSSVSLILKDDGSLRAASRVTSHTALPGAILVSTMEVLRPGKNQDGWSP